jgi:hypothetical protein
MSVEVLRLEEEKVTAEIAKEAQRSQRKKV